MFFNALSEIEWVKTERSERFALMLNAHAHIALHMDQLEVVKMRYAPQFLLN